LAGEINEPMSSQRKIDVQRLRDSITNRDAEVMEQFRQILGEVAVELDPVCVYVIMDKLRGTPNSANIPEQTYKKAEQMLRVLGVNKHWERD
jgi:hypothetical protein